jgi:hypothetical protein
MGTKSSHFFAVARFAAFAFLVLSGLAQPARAADLPLASGSILAGIGFDDRPLLLPVQRNFQMAMLTAGSELGRSCGKMEAYGWRMSQSEQSRVDQIFNSTVDRLRGLGYVVELQTPNSISRDITMFTADRPNRHLLSMWSAGEIGLVMVMCETSAPPVSHTATGVPVWPSVQTFPQDVMQSKLEAPLRKASPKTGGEKFSPVGTWVGSYVCSQGYTGAALSISQIRGDNFEGTFHFYPTAKNPSVPEGRYAVYGQYDRESQRILINPGRWLQRPRDYFNTIIVGSFDPMDQSLSAYFQGINGCTSFEARRDHKGVHEAVSSHHKHAKKPKAKKRAVKASVKTSAVETPVVAPAIVAAPTAEAATAVAPAAVAAADAPTTPAPAAAVQEKAPLVVGAPTPGISTAAPTVAAPQAAVAPAVAAPAPATTPTAQPAAK